MKCPKCQYLTYDQGDRCRNCGYEFSLSIDAEGLDLPIRTGDEPLGPLADFELGETAPAAPNESPADPPSGARGRSYEPPAARPPRSSELPLFHGQRGDAPLVSLPASPRAPVSVRKSAVARPAPRRGRDEEPTLDLDGDPAERPAPPEPRRMAAPAPHARETAAHEPAPVGARLLGAAIDLALMAAIDAAVLYFTLLASDLTFAEIDRIPIPPFAAFLVMLNGGYMAAFTAAGGQSFGKMAAGIRVITSDEHAWSDRVTLGQSALRAVLYLLSALPAGLGFAPALFGPDHRALHDRLAHTRVVKA
jgi:uncharacterized RDD family membrane protein YckC